MRVQPWVHGTCVFVFPNNFPHFSSSDENSTANKYSLPTSSITGSRKKLRALVVDDVLDVLDMLRVLLTHAGFDVVTANSAPAAVNAAREDQFDVIISDIGMPGMNGYELARALRALPGYDAVPIVAVTGYSVFDDRGKAMKAGFNAHLTKPIDPQSTLISSLPKLNLVRPNNSLLTTLHLSSTVRQCNGLAERLKLTRCGSSMVGHNQPAQRSS